jgi:CBS domain-containing protein/gamma-glutamyl:cysteine ligase YbdK (ATP-grasp superfamily)
MGSQKVQGVDGAGREGVAPACAVMQDLQVLERMIEAGLLEDTPTRIGVEQELLLVDPHLAPAPVAAEILERVRDPRLTVELARYNLEANATPRALEGASLSGLWRELDDIAELARAAAAEVGAEVLLAGYLPTCQLPDAAVDRMTPGLRYRELARHATESRAGRVPFALHGVDMLAFTHDSIMLEAPATSFQVHLQVPPGVFADVYNAALVAAAPVLAAAPYSPLVCGRRLWQESRIPLIEAATDVRRPGQQRRPGPWRTSFGDGWVERSVLELFERDLLRFPAFLEPCIPEPSLELLEAGEIPALRALTTFNGTVWRWLRPCYGLVAGRPHLRIEARFLAAGPTLADEIANAALWTGLLHALPLALGDVRRRIDFADAQANFYAAARDGLDAELRWVDGERVTARDLLSDSLLALAWDGLEAAGVARADIARAMAVVQQRVETGRTGAAWALAVYDAAPPGAGGCERAWRVTDAMVSHCWSGKPVHEWPVASRRRVGAAELPPVSVALHTDLCSLPPDAPVGLAVLMMRRRGTSQLVVEDPGGTVEGLLTEREISEWREIGAPAEMPVSALLMEEMPLVVAPGTPVDDAVAAMRAAGRTCAVVLSGEKLAGVIELSELVEVIRRTGAEARLRAVADVDPERTPRAPARGESPPGALAANART